MFIQIIDKIGYLTKLRRWAIILELLPVFKKDNKAEALNRDK